MDLYILRHGLAVDHGAPGYSKDSDRPLTPKGERKLWRVAEAMEAFDLSFDLILSSPYTRARQTAELVAGALNAAKKLKFTDTLIPSGSIRELINLITRSKPLPDSVLFVGHEPYLSELISLLISGNETPVLLMKKGGLCKLICESVKAGRCATLEWLLTPKQMALVR